MWTNIVLVVGCFVRSAWSDCDQTIKVEGIGPSYGNDKVNGDYIKFIDGSNSGKACNSRDVFNHSTHDIYLLHIADGISGYWIFRDTFTCSPDINNGFVRANDAEFNPGFVQTGWVEKQNGDWDLNPSIDVDCYEIAECTYQIVGATDGSLNGNYRNTGTSCELFRNVYKHENKEAYLYFIWSPSRFEYFWLVNSVSCVDSVYSGAYLQVDDYSAYPELIFQTWEELIPNGGYQPNSNIDVDCLSNGLSPGAIAGIVIGCLAFVALVGGLAYFCFRKRD